MVATFAATDADGAGTTVVLCVMAAVGEAPGAFGAGVVARGAATLGIAGCCGGEEIVAETVAVEGSAGVEMACP